MSPHARRITVLAWRVLVGILGLSAAVVLAGNERGLFAVGAKKLFLVAVFVATVAFLDGLAGTINKLRARGRDAALARVQKALVTLLVQISDDHGVAILHLGASVFVPRLRWVGFKHHLLGPRMVRVVRFRLNDHPQPSPVSWSKGKGAVGCCWATAREVHRDWHPQLQHSQSDLTATAFQSLPPLLRDGFTYTEFVAISAKYSEVLAVPVLSEGGGTVGVISIDVANQAFLGSTVLDATGVYAQADTAATLVRDDLRQLYAQT